MYIRIYNTNTNKKNELIENFFFIILCIQWFIGKSLEIYSKQQKIINKT